VLKKDANRFGRCGKGCAVFSPIPAIEFHGHWLTTVGGRTWMLRAAHQHGGDEAETANDSIHSHVDLLGLIAAHPRRVTGFYVLCTPRCKSWIGIYRINGCPSLRRRFKMAAEHQLRQA
jgi:hypothetical protein